MTGLANRMFKLLFLQEACELAYVSRSDWGAPAHFIATERNGPAMRGGSQNCCETRRRAAGSFRGGGKKGNSVSQKNWQLVNPLFECTDDSGDLLVSFCRSTSLKPCDNNEQALHSSFFQHRKNVPRLLEEEKNPAPSKTDKNENHPEQVDLYRFPSSQQLS